METTEVVSMKGNHVETRWKLLSGFHALETIWKLSTCSFRMVSMGFPFHGNSFFRAVNVIIKRKKMEIIKKKLSIILVIVFFVLRLIYALQN